MSTVELATSLAILMTAIITLVVAWTGRKKVKAVEEKVDEVHVLVNSRLTAVLDRVEQLTQALEAENMPVPEPPHGTF